MRHLCRTDIFNNSNKKGKFTDLKNRHAAAVGQGQFPFIKALTATIAFPTESEKQSAQQHKK